MSIVLLRQLVAERHNLASVYRLPWIRKRIKDKADESSASYVSRLYVLIDVCLIFLYYDYDVLSVSCYKSWCIYDSWPYCKMGDDWCSMDVRNRQQTHEIVLWKDLLSVHRDTCQVVAPIWEEQWTCLLGGLSAQLVADVINGPPGWCNLVNSQSIGLTLTLMAQFMVSNQIPTFQGFRSLYSTIMLMKMAYSNKPYCLINLRCGAILSIEWFHIVMSIMELVVNNLY